MLEMLMDALSLIFILCGMFFVGYIIFQKLLLGRKCRKTVTLMAGFKDDDKLPEEVYAAYMASNLLNIVKKNEVIVLDFGVEKSVKEACINIVGDSRNVIFCPREEIEDIIGHLC